jgi:peptidoglycan/xylan/chitin deacetylase (PgdA/CDA1 family)
MSSALYAANHPAEFWRPLLAAEPDAAQWDGAISHAAAGLPYLARLTGDGIERLLEATLGEGQFGAGHWRLSPARRLYYLVKPLLPRPLVVSGRRRAQARAQQSFPLGWPIEDRYRRFLWVAIGELMALGGLTEVPFLFFWPFGTTYALVLTHDVETADGQHFVRRVADLEERLGFRSSFNFVAERYPLDHELIAELAARGFEVGVHGRRHDGRELRSRRVFERHARSINQHLHRLGAVGFRSPLTHRHPEWMQALDVEYDASFFDSDPFEPVPGGTMSLWPFTIGRFLELPYTLAQDFTLVDVLGERSPRLWLEKAAYLRRFCGMALLNSHPDYLREPCHERVYREFLEELSGDPACWNALPREVARWWRRRAAAGSVETLPGARIGLVQRNSSGETEVVS